MQQMFRFEAHTYYIMDWEDLGLEGCLKPIKLPKKNQHRGMR